MTDSTTKYEFVSQGSPTGLDHNVRTGMISRKQIIDLARVEAGSDGNSLESFTGIKLVCLDKSVPADDREYEYEHMLTGDEEFEAALDYHRRYGARFDIKEREQKL